ncbi:PAS domain S-box protein [Pseudothauera nasutitermitis]|uniref:histidine kinase n=1 Tax=Pseudothauera nasutitermitis TaxID=2565930 RepID=A0A4S4AVL4_9RHOO|nr:PAS domain S-box protein [Pseudothauera nasutitermitis]THF63874.1 PAS domain S-box protein [Pseudothauera nasutitermitis]
MKRGLSLRQLMLGFVALFWLLVAGAQFTFIMYTYTTEVLSEIRLVVRHAGDNLAANLEAGLQDGDERHARQMVVQMHTLPHLRYAAYLDEREVVRFASVEEMVGAPLAGDLQPPASLLGEARRRLAGQIVDDAERDMLWAAFPVRLGSEGRSGLVVLAADTAVIQREALRRALRQTLVVLGPILLLSLGIGVLVKVLLTDRIEQLLAYTRSLLEGQDLPPPISGQDELGQLGERLAGLTRSLVESRDFHVHLLDGMPNPIWRAAADGQRDYVNRAWLRFTGRQLDQELGDGWTVGLHPQDAGPYMLAWRAAFAARQPFAAEYRLRSADGVYRWMADHAEPIYGGAQEFIGYIGSCFDLQQQKDAAARIAANEARFRGLVERSLVGVYVIQGGRLTYANPCLTEWFGYAPGEIEGVGVESLVEPDDLMLVREMLRQRMEGAVVHLNYTFRARRRDGSAFPVEVFGSRIELDGRPAVIGTMLDVTERERAQAALAAAAEVVEASPTVLFRWAPEDGQPVRYVSENVSRWGYRAADMMAEGFRFTDLVHAEDRVRIGEEVAAHLAEGRHEFVQEYRLCKADGEYIWVEDLVSVHCAADGTVAHFAGLITDISERHAAQEALQQLNTELEERVARRTEELAALNKELETFAYSVSHDLKAPLRGIDGYSHLLLEDYGARLDEEGRLFIANIRNGVAQMGRLIDDLLAYSRIERRSLQFVDIPLPEMVRGILAERAAELEGGATRVEVDVPDLVVRADPDGLAQALRNLIDNAFKYSRAAEHPVVRIGAAAEERAHHIWVQDNGIGFDMKFHERIFEIFQRLQRAEDYAGTGVGLAIVRRALTRMGGRVWAESAPGEGATFHLELPR